ncbi:MAG TPA: heavy-metal-associated domain-containing protein [Saprospiraceae bacterium]|nr:heavy-metal-associated domain-containing protein [Saprospiraceae bacterium]
MKYLMQFLSLGFLVFLTVGIQAQHDHISTSHHASTTSAVVSVADTTVSFMVYGNCGMCKRRIEGSLAEVEGIHSAAWDRDSKTMSVSYDAGLISLNDMKRRIAAVGHDTDAFRTEDKVYNDLPGCCQYERPKSEEAEN